MESDKYPKEICVKLIESESSSLSKSEEKNKKKIRKKSSSKLMLIFFCFIVNLFFLYILWFTNYYHELLYKVSGMSMTFLRTAFLYKLDQAAYKKRIKQLNYSQFFSLERCGFEFRIYCFRL